MDGMTPPIGPPPVTPAPGNPIPAGPTAPAAAPTQNAGLQARVPMLVEAGLKPLKEALKLVDPVSPEGEALHKALMLLTKHFGKPGEDISRAEMKLMDHRAGPVGPTNPAAFQKAMQQTAGARLGQPMPAGAGG